MVSYFRLKEVYCLEDYNLSLFPGGRMANEIVGWVEKKIGPAAEPLEDAEKVKDFLSDKEVAVIGFFKDQVREEANLKRQWTFLLQLPPSSPKIFLSSRWPIAANISLINAPISSCHCHTLFSSSPLPFSPQVPALLL